MLHISTRSPTNEMALMSGWSQMKLTVSCWPWMTLTTPSGMPASRRSSTSAMHAEGSRSEGFITYVLPQMVPIGNILQLCMVGQIELPGKQYGHSDSREGSWRPYL